ncbi:MAG: ParB N-terminal domain-containing protein [Clostridia bacterium]|nr:ParB N-terminal domain-containing protein [Clostridia bacterium]
MDFEQEFELIPVTRVKIADTEAYSKHPFRVVHNKALEMLAEDIKEHGLLNPILVRVLGFGGRYEILSGHRRMEALKLNGETEADVRIIKCTDIEAANIVIQSNFLQRDKILPSERAKVYMLRNECLKREKYGTLSTGWTKLDENTQEALAKEFDVSKSNIYEYIRLNYLIDDLLILVDSGKIKIKISVALSYFSKECQSIIHQYFFVDKKDILNSEYVKKIKKHRNNLAIEILEKITAELGEPKQKSERYVDSFVKKYVGKFKSEQEMADVLEKLLIGYLKDNKLFDKKGGE